MLKLLLKILAACTVALILAALLLARNISSNLDSMSVANGDWRIIVDAGSADAGVMQKASVAMGGLLASTRENSVYYRLASVAGEPLRLDCRYRIEGGDYEADWWSLTAYGWDNYLIPNARKRYSFNNENLERDESGRWAVTVAAAEHTGNWLPVGPSGAPQWRKMGNYDFDILLRLYTPGDVYLDSPESAPLPTVTREACE